jgi:hypothetical protein
MGKCVCVGGGLHAGSGVGLVWFGVGVVCNVLAWPCAPAVVQGPWGSEVQESTGLAQSITAS